MDRERFDALARLLATKGSRRGALGTIFGVALFGQDPEEGLAKRGKQKRKGRDKNRRKGRDKGRGQAQPAKAEAEELLSQDAASEPVAGSDEPEVQAEGQGSGKSQRRRRKGKSKNKGKNRKQQRRRQRAQAEQIPTSCCGTKSCAKPAKGQNRQKCNYAGQDLSGINASGANMQQVDGRGTIFSTLANPSNWTGVNWYRACLQGAKFNGAILDGANFDQACLFDADLSGAKVNNSTNTDSAKFCRTTLWDGTVSDRDCNRGTTCCPACESDDECEDGQVCCNGRCRTGDCCVVGDCPDELCQTKACTGFNCEYTPVFGESGPGCAQPRICCENAQGDPVCCPQGVEICDEGGQCCSPDCAGKECGPDGCGGACPPGCPGGQTCDDSGQCVVPCGNETCDPDTEICCSNGEVFECVEGICCQIGDPCNSQAECCDTNADDTNCVNGVCCIRNGSTCSESAECCGNNTCCPTNNDGSICVNTRNDEDNCGACGNVCPDNATCTAGVCVCDQGFYRCGEVCIPVSACCEGDNAEGCPGQQHCCVVEGNGVCRECCDNADCDQGEECQNGTCVPVVCTGECTKDSECPPLDNCICCGTTCVTGECCQDDPDHPCQNPNPVCNDNNMCVPCTTDNQCGPGEVCCDGSCFMGICCEDSDCQPTGNDCVGNQCQCGAGQPCQEPTPNCCGTAPDGACQECCDNGDCDPNETCISGKCCADADVCDGFCLTGICGTPANTCGPDGQGCGLIQTVEGTCFCTAGGQNCALLETCNTSADCDAGFACNEVCCGERKCWRGCETCIDSSDCGQNEVCCDGTCFEGVCCQDSDCQPTGNDCVNHQCFCGNVQTCGEGFTCCDGDCVDTQIDPENCGACNNPCEDGEACVEGQCEQVVCDAENCSDGCCTNGPGNPGECRPGDTVDECGSEGRLCLECGACQTCTDDGTCEFPPECTADLERHEAPSGSGNAGTTQCQHDGFCRQTIRVNITGAPPNQAYDVYIDQEHEGDLDTHIFAGTFTTNGDGDAAFEGTVDVIINSGNGLGVCPDVVDQEIILHDGTPLVHQFITEEFPPCECCPGTCGDLTNCPDGEFCCADVCVTESVYERCDQCGTRCDSDDDEVCCDGVCVDEDDCDVCPGGCPQGETCCGGECVDLQTNHDHCGSCGDDCNSNQVCEAGDCCRPNGTACNNDNQCCSNNCPNVSGQDTCQP